VDLHKGRDLAQIFERPRATEPLLKGRAGPGTAIAVARALIAAARRRSRWCRAGARTRSSPPHRLGLPLRLHVKTDHAARPGERIEVSTSSSRPTGRTAPARANLPELPDDKRDAFPFPHDLIWSRLGEAAADRLPRSSKRPPRRRKPENDRPDVFIPISVQTERNGHYTNFAGVAAASMVLREAAGIATRDAFARSAAAPGGGDVTRDANRRLIFIV
jgi:NADH-quinone oxidoreductase subunit G